MGLIKLTLLIVGLDNITRKLLTNFETNKFRTYRVTEFHVKNTSFFHFWGGRGGPIKLTLLIGGLDNLTRNLNTKFKIANLKSF